MKLIDLINDKSLMRKLTGGKELTGGDLNEYHPDNIQETLQNEAMLRIIGDCYEQNFQGN